MLFRFHENAREFCDPGKAGSWNSVHWFVKVVNIARLVFKLIFLTATREFLLSWVRQAALRDNVIESDFTKKL